MSWSFLCKRLQIFALITCKRFFAVLYRGQRATSPASNLNLLPPMNKPLIPVNILDLTGDSPRIQLVEEPAGRGTALDDIAWESIQKTGLPVNVGYKSYEPEDYTPTAPIVNMNGDSKSSLTQEIREAAKAVDLAIQKVKAVTVHMRNFHIVRDGQERYDRAIVEKRVQLTMLNQVRSYYEYMAEALASPTGK